MKTIFVVLFFFSVCFTSFSESFTLSWKVEEDSNIDSYTVTHGSDAGVSVSRNVGKVNEYTIDNLSSGRTYYFVVRCYDKSRRFSSESNVIIYTVPQKHHKPKRVSPIIEETPISLPTPKLQGTK